MNKKTHLIDVQPIRSKEQIGDMKWALKRHCFLFIIGINTGLRIGDLLQLETKSVLELKRKKRKEFKLKKEKRRKNGWLTSIFDEVYEYAQAVQSI